MRAHLARHLTVALATATLVVAVGAAAIAAPAHEPGPDCQVLVTYTTDGVQGDELAVAITSQSLEADVPGWGHISWQAGPTASVTAVVVTGSGGTTRIEAGDLSNGTVADVLAVTFCGSTGSTDEGHDHHTDGGTADEAVVVAGGGDHSTAAGGAATDAETARAPAVDIGTVAPAPVDTSLAGLRAARIEVDSLLTPARPRRPGGEATEPATSPEDPIPAALASLDASPAAPPAGGATRPSFSAQPEAALVILTGLLTVVVAVEFARRQRQLVEVRP